MRNDSIKVVSFFIILYILVFSKLVASQYDCKSSRCSHHSPAIRFPFRLQGRQPNHCAYPGFDLYCTRNKQTVLKLPSNVTLYVKRINYMSQTIDVYDPDHCIARHIQSLNISARTFQFQEQYTYNYTLLNCSETERYASMTHIACLSNPRYQVYAVNSYDSIAYMPAWSCSKIVDRLTVPYNIFYGTNELRLKWSKPMCGHCEAAGRICRLSNSSELQSECFDNPKSGATTKRLLIGVIIGSSLLVLVAIKLYCAYSSNRMETEHQLRIEKFLEDYNTLRPSRYTYADVKRITNRFQEKLGQGGYGAVFKGKLSHEILVAVKIIYNSKGDGEEFINEVGIMGRIHHVNMVRLVGFCADGYKRALVYEFLPNESLEKFIFSADARNSFLCWKKLQDIALGIAKGIEYLHQGCDQQILHFDIKPHNILLDHNFNPKISDFGFAKLCAKEQSAVSMTAARGTMGYIAPEVFSRNFGNVSYKSDVYSFGMLLLEMVSGRKNIDTTVEKTSQVYFPEWVYSRLDRGEDLGIRIEAEADAKIAKKLTLVGLRCIQWCPGDRPSMKKVVQMLEGESDNLTMPPNPFASTNQTTTTATVLGRSFDKELEIIPEQE